MKKSTISMFFEVLTRKISSCSLKNYNTSKLDFFKFNFKTPIYFLKESVITSCSQFPNPVFNHAKWKNQLLYSFKIFIFIFLVSSNSFAQNWPPIAPVNPPSGGFNIDGRAKVNSSYGDWTQGTLSSETGGYVLQPGSPNWSGINGSTTKFIRDEYNNTSDKIFSGSAFSDDPNVWKWTLGKATNKCDINTAIFHATTSSTSKWLMLGGDRFTTTGTSYIDFEFSQGVFTRNGNGTFSSVAADGSTSLSSTNGRTPRDFVLSMEYSNGGTNATVHYYVWEKPSGSAVYKYVEHVIPSPGGVPSAFGATNGAVTDAPYNAFGSTTYIPYAFVEAAVNIDAILSADCIGLTIKTIFVKTKASDSYNAALKDFVDPQSVNFVFGNAGLNYNGTNFCKSGSLTPTVPASPNGTFSATPAGLSLNSTTGVINLGDSTVGSYTVTYTPSVGVCLNPATANITIVANPSALALTGSSICASAPSTGSISSTTSGNNTISYQLYNSLNATVQAAKLGTGAALDWTGLAEGNGYYVIATGSAPTSCTSTSNMVNVTAVANPSALVLTGSSICASAPGTGSISSSTSGNNTISYQLYNSSNATVQAAKLGTGAALNWTGLAEGNGYYAIATGAAPTSCTTTSNMVNVTAVINPTALVLTGSSICSSAPNTATISSSTSGNNTISYQLYNSSDATVQAAKPGTGAALNWTGLAVGNGYYVIASGTAPTSCTTTSNMVNVTAVINPTALVLTGSSI
ncbi:MAG: hypothetical protein ABWY22_14440, partial [Flavobacterium sp.]